MSVMSRFLDTIYFAFRYISRVIILGVTLAGFILLLADGVKKFLTGPDFTVQEIVIAGNKQIAQHEIRSIVSSALGRNIWLVDLRQLAQLLEAHPSIEHASVKRIPPMRIHITVRERYAIVYYLDQTDGSLYGIDADGVLLPPTVQLSHPAANQSIEDRSIHSILSHPLLHSEIQIELVPGHQIESQNIRELLEFLSQLKAQSPMLFAEIADVEYQSNQNIMLHPRRRIGVLVLRDLVAPGLIQKLDALWNVMEENHLRAVYVDARFPNKGFAIRRDEQQEEKWNQIHIKFPNENPS